jgi:hypothetical protein
VIGESDDLRPLVFGGPDRKAPFFAPAPLREGSARKDQAAKFASASARTSVPRAISSGDAYSSGR